MNSGVLLVAGGWFLVASKTMTLILLVNSYKSRTTNYFAFPVWL
jgi:hypothetical protein